MRYHYNILLLWNYKGKNIWLIKKETMVNMEVITTFFKIEEKIEHQI